MLVRGSPLGDRKPATLFVYMVMYGGDLEQTMYVIPDSELSARDLDILRQIDGKDMAQHWVDWDPADGVDEDAYEKPFDLFLDRLKKNPWVEVAKKKDYKDWRSPSVKGMAITRIVTAESYTR